jgi:hypothetical protein
MLFRRISALHDARALIAAPRSLLAAVVVSTLAVAACDFQGDTITIEPEFDDVSSFETDLDKWVGRAVDLGTPPATWEIVRSGDRATQGTQSARLRLGNLGGQTKIFLERRYAVEKNQRYLMEISFDFASADFGTVNLWRLLAGAALDSPTQVGSFFGTPADTGNGRSTDEGYVWLQKSYSQQITSDSDGELFVYVGVGGTSELSRTYYVDNVKVALTRQGLSAPR